LPQGYRPDLSNKPSSSQSQNQEKMNSNVRFNENIVSNSNNQHLFGGVYLNGINNLSNNFNNLNNFSRSHIMKNNPNNYPRNSPYLDRQLYENQNNDRRGNNEREDVYKKDTSINENEIFHDDISLHPYNQVNICICIYEYVFICVYLSIYDNVCLDIYAYVLV
jgi:hypothetical protein